MANKEYIQELIQKFIRDTCTNDERDLLFQFLQESENDELLKAIIDQEYYKFSDRKIDPEVSDEIYTTISKDINPKRERIYLLPVVKYAASFTLIIVSAIFFIYFTSGKVEYHTAYGEVLDIQLPDSSRVTLNANSSIRYNKRDFSNARKLQLQGEAFFRVKKLDNQEFIVQTDGMNVEVLGTQFNVKSRHNATNVVLSEGIVKINMKEINNELTLIPGEMVEYNKDQRIFDKKVVKTDNYISWVNNKLIFEKSTLSEIANTLKDNYGIKVVFNPGSLGDSVFTGSTPADDLDILFGSIEKLFNLNIEEENDKIIVKKLPEPSDRSR